MANKRNKPKPGSTRGVGEFRQFLHTVRVEKRQWWEQTSDWCEAPHLPMKQRKAELLAKIQAKGEGGFCTNSINFYEPVLNKLIKDGDVVLKRIIHRTGFHGANRTSMIATWFPEEVEERVAKPFAKREAELTEAGLTYPGQTQGKERIPQKTINWTKEKDQQLLIDMIKGEADPQLVAAVNRTKTKFRKIRVDHYNDKEDNK